MKQASATEGENCCIWFPKKKTAAFGLRNSCPRQFLINLFQPNTQRLNVTHNFNIPTNQNIEGKTHKCSRKFQQACGNLICSFSSKVFDHSSSIADSKHTNSSPKPSLPFPSNQIKHATQV